MIDQFPYLVSAPQQPLILRPRLLSLLQASLHSKVTLISAPPGYGKTTLVRQFAEQAPFPVAWHTVESRERDLPNLHSHSIEALGEIIPELEDLSPASRASAHELASNLTACLRKHAKRDYLYVLDDIHE